MKYSVDVAPYLSLDNKKRRPLTGAYRETHLRGGILRKICVFMSDPLHENITLERGGGKYRPPPALSAYLWPLILPLITASLFTRDIQLTFGPSRKAEKTFRCVPSAAVTGLVIERPREVGYRDALHLNWRM